MVTNIVMIAHDRPELTLQALVSLAKYTDPESYNLTIIDDASKVPVQFGDYRLEPLAPRTAILRIERSKGITGQARNLGVYWAERYWGRGDWLYLSDNDVYFKEGWLDILIDAMRHTQGRVALLGGGTHPFHQPTTEYGQTLRGHLGPCVGNRAVLGRDAVAGYSHFMKWDLWDRFGPHEAHAPGTGKSEDFKFCQDVLKAGFGVASLEPEVVVNCGVTNTAGEQMPGADLVRERALSHHIEGLIIL